MKLQQPMQIAEVNEPRSEHSGAPRADFALASARHLSALLQLTKPKIMLLVLITGTTALILEGTMVSHPGRFILFLLGLYTTGGAANAFNQYFERDIDARMERTRKRRPLPMGIISPTEAAVFSSITGILGVAILWIVFNPLTAMLAAGTMLFYSLFYTLWLKPNTPQNIVIGGIAGAMAPVGAWTAATGEMALIPWILFSIVFFWTPPHFWSLALYFKSDYEKARLPMMPVIKGVDGTLRLIYGYSIALVAVSLTFIAAGGGWLYAAVAIGLGFRFIQLAHTALKGKEHGVMWRLFTFSIFYLFGLFAAMVADKIIVG